MNGIDFGKTEKRLLKGSPNFFYNFYMHPRRYTMHTYRQEPVPHQLYAQELCNNLIRWLKRKSRSLLDEWLEAALILMSLNLESARPILEPLYSKDPRGQKPYDPVRMLRALLMMVLLKYTSITKFAEALKAKPRLARIAGFEAYDVPAAGTFYAFIDRLEDGQYQKPCERIIKPSKLRKGKHTRNLTSEKQQRQKDKKADMGIYDSVTKKLKDDLQKSADQPRPDGLLKRLEDILIQCAIIPSAQKGLLGDTNSMSASGDGSALPSGANPYGKPSCNCREKGIYDCQCPRYYSDPTANWGYDSYRETYYFGHTYYQYVVSTSKHDLPLPPSIAPGAETDFTLSLNNLDRLKKALKENGLEWKIKYAIHDAGHDSRGNYEYLLDCDISPIIALNPRTGIYSAPTGNAQKVNEQGIPICPAGMLMRRHGFNPQKQVIMYNCPVKRPTHKDGRYIYVSYPQECPFKVLCQPDTNLGPTVCIRTKDDPRLYPPIPRGTATFKELMNLRSGCERSNSAKKDVYSLGQRPCRSDTHFLVRLYLVSIIEHAKAWLAEDKKQLGDEPITLINARAA
jgi:hypothetical protein